MKSTATWKTGFESVVDNGRGHEVVADLPQAKNGTDKGATALELALMGLSGCISTIYAVVAQKMRLSFTSLEVVCEAEKPDDAPTITKVNTVVNISSEASPEKLQKCLDATLKSCPVGVLYTQAGVEHAAKLNIL